MASSQRHHSGSLLTRVHWQFITHPPCRSLILQEIWSLTQKECQRIATSPPSLVLNRPLLTCASNEQKITGNCILIYDRRYITASMITSMTHSRHQMIRPSSDGIRQWNQEKYSTKSRQRMSAPLQQPSFKTIRCFGVCTPSKMPPKFCFVESKIARKCRSLERIRTWHSSYLTMLYTFSSNAGTTPAILKIGTAKPRPTRSGPT
jgi:hypothetical protein